MNGFFDRIKGNENPQPSGVGFLNAPPSKPEGVGFLSEAGKGSEGVGFLSGGGDQADRDRGELPWYVDIPLAIGAYAGSAAVLAPTGPGVIAAPLLGAAAYIGAKRLLTGEDPKPILTGLIPGAEKINPTLLATAEEVALFYAGGPIMKGAGKVVRGLVKGVDRALRPAIRPAARALAPAGEKAWQILSLPKKIPIAGKTIAERLQPAIERMAPETAEAFRSTRVDASLVNEVGNKLGKTLQRETPQVRAEVAKAFQKENPLQGVKTSRAKELIGDFEAGIKVLNLDKKYEQDLHRHLSKLMPKSVNVSSKAMKVFEQPEGSTIREIHNGLREIIQDPGADEATRQLAKDLWNLPAHTPAAVMRSSKAASFEYLISKVKTMPGAVSNELKTGFVKSEIPALKGAIINKDIELEFQAMEKIPKIAEGLFNKYFMSPWKTNKVILRPATHMRNMISNVILNDWGGLPFYRADIYMDAIKGMTKGAESWKEFRRMIGSTISNFTESDLLQMDAGLKYGSNILDKALNVYDKIAAPMRSLYSAEESLFKYAKYLHNLELGLGKKEAAWDAVKWTFNYGEITPEVARIGKWAIPFFRWFSKVIPLGLETATKHPVRFGKWIGFGMGLQSAAMESTGISNDEWDRLKEGMPEYLQKGMYLLMPWRDDDNNLQMLNLTYTLPFIGDVSELYQKSPAESLIQNPVFTAASTFLSKKKFSGIPLYYDWEDPSTKAMKSFAYAWEQLMPAIAPPGGTDWKKLWDAFTGVEGAMSVEQALANAAGFKLTPVDPIANAKRKDAIRNIYEREMKGVLKREIKKSKSSEDTQEIIRRYQQRRMEVR